MGVIELLAWFYVDILILGDDHILERFVTIWLNVWSWHPLGWVGTISPSAKDTLDSPQQHKYPLSHQSPFVTNIPGARKVKVCVQLLSIHLHWNIYLQISNSAGTGTEAPKQFVLNKNKSCSRMVDNLFSLRPAIALLVCTWCVKRVMRLGLRDKVWISSCSVFKRP